jgi:hypothetical protein
VGLHQSHIQIRPLQSLSLAKLNFVDRNVLVGDHLCLFEHGLDGATLLLGSDIELLVYLRQWKLNDYARLVSQQDVVFFEALLFLDELITHPCKFAVLQLGRQVLLYTEVDLPMLPCSLDEVELVLVGKEDEEIVGGLIVEVED